MRRLLIGLAGGMLAGVSILPGQCTTRLDLRLPHAGVDAGCGGVLEWDPDGAGPRSALIVASGAFTVAGDVAANAIAAWDPATDTWHDLDGGVDGSVLAMAVLPSGELLVAGSFTTAGGVNAADVAVYDGTTWSALGAGPGAPIASLAVMPNGDVCAGIDLNSNPTQRGVRRWDGASWTSLGSLDGHVAALLALPNGDLVAGGRWQPSTGFAQTGVVRWNGAGWSVYGAPMPGFANDSQVRALALDNGQLVAGGDFVGVGGNYVSRFDGVAWRAIGTGLSAPVYALHALPNGGFAAAGVFRLTGPLSGTLFAIWDGLSWSSPGGGITGESWTIQAGALEVLAGGDIVIGGTFRDAGGATVDNIARFDGVEYRPLGRGIAAPVLCAASDGAGGLFLGGHFRGAADRVARLSGGTLQPLGTGLDGSAFTMVTMPNGDLIVGGEFTHAGGVRAAGIARWNGSAWSPLGLGLHHGTQPVEVRDLALTPDDRVVAVGTFTVADAAVVNNVAIWDGQAWAPVGAGVSMGLDHVAVSRDGRIFAGGRFVTAAGVPKLVVEYAGNGWTGLGAGSDLGQIRGLCCTEDGELYVAGQGMQFGGQLIPAVARWDGSAWIDESGGLGSAVSVRALPDGGVLVFTGATLERQGANGWLTLHTASQNTFEASPTFLVDGTVVLGGWFEEVDQIVAPHFATISPNCGAEVTSYGAGCASGTGVGTLRATQWGWSAGEYRFVGTGMPDPGVVIGVRGLATQSVPLASVLPQGGPGCDLLVSPDLLDLYLPVAGEVRAGFSIPAAPALVGAQLHQQLVGVGFDANGAIANVTSSNALTLTIGRW